MNLDLFLNKYDIEPKNEIPNLMNYYSEAAEMYSKFGNEIMNFEKYNIFTYMKEDISRLRDSLLLEPDNVIYCYFLYLALKNNDTEAIKLLAKPKKTLKDEKYDILPLFSLLYRVPSMIEEHKKRGIPSDVTTDTCNMFENQVQDFVNLFHRYGISEYVGWMKGFVDCKIIRIGRFNFEITSYKSPYDIFENKDNILKILPYGQTFHKSGQILGSVGCEDTEDSFSADIIETDEYYEGCVVIDGLCINKKTKLYKTEWKKFLTKGDAIVSIHIPTGGKMTPDICGRDLKKCREIVTKCFGSFKAFYCSSWLLDPQIKGIIGKETNLTHFSDRFEKFPLKSNGNDVFEYVYGLPSPPQNLEELPETSSFSKAIKQHLLCGKHIYGANGVFK